MFFGAPLMAGGPLANIKQECWRNFWSSSSPYEGAESQQLLHVHILATIPSAASHRAESGTQPLACFSIPCGIHSCREKGRSEKQPVWLQAQRGCRYSARVLSAAGGSYRQLQICMPKQLIKLYLGLHPPSNQGSAGSSDYKLSLSRVNN